MENCTDNKIRIGLFVGSFDPFTIGHDSIVRRALPLFDKIVIGIGINERKQYMQNCRTTYVGYTTTLCRNSTNRGKKLFRTLQ